MIVLENDDAVAAYIERRLGISLSHPRSVVGFMTDEKRPLCAVVMNDYTGANIELTIVAERGGLTRGVVGYLARHVFIKNGCRRLTVRTKKRNKLVARMAGRFGFTFECVAKQYFHDDDAVVYRMLKSECRWLPEAARVDQ